jgi:hypothetical protein
MDFWAIKIIEPTINKVKDLLLPFNIGTWMKLALIVLMAGASSGGGGYVGNFGNMGDLGDFEESGITEGDIDAFLDEFLTDEVVILAIFAAIIILFLFWIFWGYISSVFAFIFLEAAITKKIEIVSGFKRNMGKGFDLFLFKVGAAVVFLALFALLFGVLIFGRVMVAGIPFAIIILSILLFLVLFVLLLLFAGMIFSMAEDFAVPMMSMRGQGVISSMRHSLALFRKQFWQFIVYYVMKAALGFAAGIVALIALIPVLLLMAVVVAVFAVIWVVSGISLSLSAPIIALLVIVLIVGTIVFVYLSALVTLPIPVYFRYYSLLFLKKMDNSLDFEKGLP